MWGECPPPAPEPGSTGPSALDLGTLGGLPADVCQKISEGDVDVYRFKSTEARSVMFALTGRDGGVKVKLSADMNGDGDPEPTIESILVGDSDDLVFSKDLVAGIYYLTISTWPGVETEYRLHITSMALPALVPDPGITMQTAHVIGEFSGREEAVLRDLRGAYDIGDLYRFTVTEAMSVSISMLERTDGILMQLWADLDGNGAGNGNEALLSSGTAAATDFTVSKDLVPGVYHISILPMLGDE